MNETKIMLKNVRLSYAHIWTPEATISDPNKKKYSAVLLIPKNSPQIPAIREAIAAAVQQGMGVLGRRVDVSKKPLRDGEEKIVRDQFGNIESGHEYEGMYFLSASSNGAPGIGKPRKDASGKPVRDAAGHVIIDKIENEQEVYSGCYCHVSVNFYAYSQAGNKGIACGLNNICKFKDGDNLGGRVSAQSDFGSSLSDEDMYDPDNDDMPDDIS